MYFMGNPNKHSDNQEPISDLIIFYPISDILIPFFHLLGFIPNHLTILSTFCTFYSVYLYRISNQYSYLFYFFGYLFDAMDGRMARKYNQSSIFGMILDLVSDNITNIPLFIVLIEKSLYSYFTNYIIGIFKFFLLLTILVFVFLFGVTFGMNEAYNCYLKTKNDNFYLYKKDIIKKSVYNSSYISDLYLLINKSTYYSYRLFFEDELNETNKINLIRNIIKYKEIGSGNLNLYVLLVMLLISNL